MDPEYIKKLISDPPDPEKINLLSALMNEAFEESYGEPQNLSKPSAFGHIEKHGLKIGFSLESVLRERKGHWEPVGVKWVQRIGWLWGLLLFKAYTRLEKSLKKTRHFNEVSGYDYEEAYYKPFKQKTKWIKDEEETA